MPCIKAFAPTGVDDLLLSSHFTAILEGTTLLGTGDPKSNHLTISGSMSHQPIHHPHPGLSQALPPTTTPTRTHHPSKSSSLLSAQPLGQSYSLGSPVSLESLCLAPKSPPPWNPPPWSSTAQLAESDPVLSAGSSPSQTENLEHQLEHWP